MGFVRFIAVLSLSTILCGVAWAQMGPRPRRPTGSAGPDSDVVEQFSLSGRVLISNRLEPAKRVGVRLVTVGGGLISQTFTDERGTFEFRNLSRGVYLVQVNEDGYFPAQERMDLNLGTRSDAVLMLEPRTDLRPKPAGDILSVRDLQIPEKARESFRKGMEQLYEKKEPRLSLSHFQRAIEQFHEYDEAYVQLGMAYLQIQQPAEAERALRAGIEVNPKNGPALGLLGTACNQQDKYAEAVPFLQDALRLGSPAWQAEFELGRAYIRLKDLDQALTHARKAHELKPDMPGPLLQLYNVLIHRQEYSEAVVQLEKFIAGHPEHPATASLRQKQDELKQAALASSPQ